MKIMDWWKPSLLLRPISSTLPELRRVELQEAPNRDQSRVTISVFQVSDRDVRGALIATDSNHDPAFLY